MREAIREGDVYQVNLVQHLWADFAGDPLALAAALAPLRPLEPAALQGDGWTIVSASPELLLQKRGRVVRTSPIKGTRPAGVPIESAKDAAEHVMIVDLERNDLSRVCVPGSVRWPELLAERQLAGVTHLVATVEGELRPDVALTELLDAVLPGGSVTGCPKSSALELIAALEPVGRGASMGALGRIYANGDLDLALTIRTFAVVDDEIHLWVGGGIVWDSEADAEIEESWVKARPLLALADMSSSHVRSGSDVGRVMGLRQSPGAGGRSARAGVRGRRRGAAARPLGLRDGACLRRPAVPARPAPRALRRLGRARRAFRRPTPPSASGSPALVIGACGERISRSGSTGPVDARRHRGADRPGARRRCAPAGCGSPSSAGRPAPSRARSR